MHHHPVEKVLQTADAHKRNRFKNEAMRQRDGENAASSQIVWTIETSGIKLSTLEYIKTSRWAVRGPDIVRVAEARK